MKQQSVKEGSRGPTSKGHKLNQQQAENRYSASNAAVKSLIVGTLAASSILATFGVSADEVANPLSVPVKVLSSPQQGDSQSEMQNVPMQAPRPQPTTPGGKLPQYQLGHHHRTLPAEADLSNPTLRLILALPDMPILVAATITIDGQPYLMARERRIQQILEDAAKPAPEVVEVAPKSEDEASSETASAEPSDETPSDNDDEGAESDKVSTAPVEETPAPADSESEEDDAENDPEQDEDTEEEEPVAAPTVPAYSLPSSVAERVRRFVAATGEAATVDEIRWMLTNWVDGPVLLMLNDNFQRFRANQRPVFNVLDADRDGTISAGELANAVAAFEKCDFNRNDIVEYTELAKIAGDPELRKRRHSGPGKLIFRIPDGKSAVATYRRIADRYPSKDSSDQQLVPRFDVNVNGKFDAEELVVINTAQPDLSFNISFNSDDPAASKIELTATGPTLSGISTAQGDNASAIALPIAGTTVSFSAVQSGASDQISIGAVNDGYPILPVIDPNEDGRFTIRERRTLIDSLLKFDENLDGSLTSDETEATIRVCFGLGPHVHRELVALRQVNPNAGTPVVAGPDWFVRMDRNGDGDVSSNEFPGRKQHFADLDTDSDALISAQEALDYDRRQSQPSTETDATSVEPTETLTEETATETDN